MWTGCFHVFSTKLGGTSKWYMEHHGAMVSHKLHLLTEGTLHGQTSPAIPNRANQLLCFSTKALLRTRLVPASAAAVGTHGG